jgi:hypothetical protein
VKHKKGCIREITIHHRKGINDSTSNIAVRHPPNHFSFALVDNFFNDPVSKKDAITHMGQMISKGGDAILI